MQVQLDGMTIPAHRHRPTLDGLLNLDKPVGLTSARTLDQVRVITGQRKSGHAGTLDPGARGVLLVCLGRTTKLVERLMDLPKVYRASARLDVTSDSLDADTPLVPVPVPATPDAESLRRILSGWIGDRDQTPPAISALKIDGVPAYKRARRGEVLRLPARRVRIYWIRLHAFLWPTLDVEVCCGRGTYIRSLIRDIGAALGAGGCLMSLSRERVGPFSRAEAWSIHRLQACDDVTKAVIDPSVALSMIASATAPPSPPDERDVLFASEGTAP